MSHPLQLLLRFVLSAVSVLIVSAVLPGMKVKSFLDALAFSVVVAIFDVLAWHVLGLVTVTFSVLTLGIGIFIVNGVIFLLAQKIVRGVEISGCFVAAIASVLVALVNAAIYAIVR